MKPTIPETGRIIRLDGNRAVVFLEGGESCKGCGAGKIGLCRARGDSMMLTVRNEIGADIGDTIQVGIDRRVKIKGYFLAYIIPLFSFIVGAVAGHAAAGYLMVPLPDVPAAFFALALSLAYTLTRLRRLDRSAMMTVKRVVSDMTFRSEVKTDEERRYEECDIKN